MSSSGPDDLHLELSKDLLAQMVPSEPLSQALSQKNLTFHLAIAVCAGPWMKS